MSENMNVSDWFTVVSILSAFLGFLIQNELRLFLAKLFTIEKVIIGYLLLIQIPILLFFCELSNEFTFLKRAPFTIEKGIEPKNLAFLIVLTFLIYVLIRLYWLVPKNKMSKSIYAIYYSNVKQNQVLFHELFTKYESVDFINSNWNKYEEMFDNEDVLKVFVDRDPIVLLKIWRNFNQEKSFQKVFRLFIENPNSAYYSEIKEHCMLNDKPFLNKALKDNIQQSIHNGILMVFTDHVSKHLQAEHGKNNIYNKEHYHPKTKEVEGFDLPLYYHIRFIGLMYSSAIENRIDISAISHRYTNMQTIYSGMVGQMINNIIVTEENAGKECSSNYHWLIDQIFDIQSNWLAKFTEESNKEEKYFNPKSSYVSFIPFSISLCLLELYKGLRKAKITIEFLNSTIYYSILSHYFNCGFNDIMKTSIEKEIIIRIPNELVNPVLTFALDQRFGITYNDFISGNYDRLNDCEREMLLRLLKFLKDNNKI